MAGAGVRGRVQGQRTGGDARRAPHPVVGVARVHDLHQAAEPHHEHHQRNGGLDGNASVLPAPESSHRITQNLRTVPRRPPALRRDSFARRPPDRASTAPEADRARVAYGTSTTESLVGWMELSSRRPCESCGSEMIGPTCEEAIRINEA